MKLFNRTQTGTYYGISNDDNFNCGSIDANQNTDLPGWDNQANVKIVFAALGDAPPGESNPFSVTIPKTGSGMAVTIGLYQE